MRTSSTGAVAYLEGVAFWAPTLPSWETARAVFSEEREPLSRAGELPSADLLVPAERRRAPDSVVLALHVATAAVSMSEIHSYDLKSVFVSAHGDLSVTDAMCRTLARAPAQTSPTKFLHSVHNAASGYWAIATGCQRSSTAMSAKQFSFAGGLLETLCQCAADQNPVLLVGYDIEAVGPLACVNESRGMLAVALVISPIKTARSLCAVEWAASNSASRSKAPSSAALHAGLAENGMADALPFFEALSRAMPTELSMPLSFGMSVHVRLEDLTVGPPLELQEVEVQ